LSRAFTQAHEQGIDFVLGEGMFSRFLADIDARGSRRDLRQDRVRHQAIVNDHLRRLQKPQRLDGQQFRIARTRANGINGV